MHVLVCEDDPAARFVAKRWLQTALGCTVTDCEDGVEALALLSAHSFDLAVIDLDVPRLSGIEVVEAIRHYDPTHDLPVVILSNERRQDVVRRLLDLGVSDYLLKPLRAQTVYERIGPLLSKRRRVGARAGGAATMARLGPDNPAMLVDGDANFRHVFTSVTAKYGPVVCAESGASALALYRRNPADLVFIGSELGLVGPAVLIPKLREFAAADPLIVRVGAAADPAEEHGLFDIAIPRTFIPSTLDHELHRFVRTVGPMRQLEEIAPHVTECLATALPQVLGMMGGLEVTPSGDAGPHSGPVFVGSVTLDVDSRITLALELVLTRDVAVDINARLLGSSPAEIDDESCLSMVGELTNMVGGRLEAWLRAHSLTSRMTLPEKRITGAGETLPDIATGDGFQRHFMLPELQQHLSLRTRVLPADAAA